MELALRQRLAGVSAVKISESAQTTEVIFAPGDHPFSIASFKAALKQADVDVVTMELDACGTIEARGDERLLRAGTTELVLAAGSGPDRGGVCVAGQLREEAGRPQLIISRADPFTVSE